MTRLLAHVRSNAISYLALFVALGGTGYAAISLPAGSVGASQLRNHSITPDKLDPRFINGTVRAWAVVAPNGTVQAGAGKPSVLVERQTPGLYVIKWRGVAKPSQHRCFAIGGITDDAAEGASAEASLFVPHRGPWAVDLNTYGPQGQRGAQYFYTAVFC